ncbi:acetyl-CoA synthetase-like protein [Guyanagaster necrorhizus]|uniref:Acetyl-CoA synthetase-like protein n=1 Tax=Guyanagaster necrorhizus TaxID=856835 RepID=A0A9P7W086_9AGAR|nr:acetyl-CoA synthetase-like protein [Guyanagaster necrorhizus MCA 3950]KAG7450358.1 acetyl-CoA synthetase-like protein [Guyanagaster necrorhizus MCA 3950]
MLQNPLLFLLRAAQIYPDKIALAHPDAKYPVVYTFAVWAQRIQNLAYSLIRAGIKPGDRVAVISPNSPMMADACHGVLAARAILTPINTRLKPQEVHYILDHSGASLILIDEEYLPLIAGSERPRIVCKDTGTSDDPYEEFLSDGRCYSQERGWAGLDVEPDENAGALLCYTSGTTGRPKGVLTTLRGTYLAAIGNAFEGRIDKESTYLWILPMFHAGGWTFPWSNTFAFATQITQRTVNYPQIWKHFLHSKVTHYCGAPTVQIGIVNDPSAKKLTKPISAIIAGAAPTAHLLGALEGIGIKPIHVYGLTLPQTYGPFTRGYDQLFWTKMTLEQRSKLIARQGHSFATAEGVRVAEIRDDDQIVDVPRDGKTVGEIITRGNLVMKEYFRDPEATTKAFRGGYFHSGDLAVMHPDGSIAVVDRSKDIIISGGENASSLAIEQGKHSCLTIHPHVLEVSVVARAHPVWGERPMAFVTIHPEHVSRWSGRLDEFVKNLMEHAKTRLSGFARPEWVEVVPELPKTSTGKILKTELRRRAAKL